VPLLADVRDESAEDVRIVLEPRARTVEPEMLMGMPVQELAIWKRAFQPEHERADRRQGAAVCSLKEVLRAFLDHRRDVLRRRSEHRIEKIDHRLEVLEGFIIAFLNLDRVIDIIRYDDDPKAALMAEDWGEVAYPRDVGKGLCPPGAGEGELTEVQAEAILNMRLRSLRRLEEMELIAERDALMKERADLADLLESDRRQWKRVGKSWKRFASSSAKAPPGRAPHAVCRSGRNRRGAL
jgi:topoisomerase-4 subunit A